MFDEKSINGIMDEIQGFTQAYFGKEGEEGERPTQEQIKSNNVDAKKKGSLYREHEEGAKKAGSTVKDKRENPSPDKGPGDDPAGDQGTTQLDVDKKTKKNSDHMNEPKKDGEDVDVYDRDDEKVEKVANMGSNVMSILEKLAEEFEEKEEKKPEEASAEEAESSVEGGSEGAPSDEELDQIAQELSAMGVTPDIMDQSMQLVEELKAQGFSEEEIAAEAISIMEQQARAKGGGAAVPAPGGEVPIPEDVTEEEMGKVAEQANQAARSYFNDYMKGCVARIQDRKQIARLYKQGEVTDQMLSEHGGVDGLLDKLAEGMEQPAPDAPEQPAPEGGQAQGQDELQQAMEALGLTPEQIAEAEALIEQLRAQGYSDEEIAQQIAQLLEERAAAPAEALSEAPAEAPVQQAPEGMPVEASDMRDRLKKMQTNKGGQNKTASRKQKLQGQLKSVMQKSASQNKRYAKSGNRFDRLAEILGRK